jgi:hypothetical protein
MVRFGVVLPWTTSPLPRILLTVYNLYDADSTFALAEVGRWL